ncbi:MAG: dockerin type I domain-containing protein [Phycisphaeraceae bacterium]
MKVNRILKSTSIAAAALALVSAAPNSFALDPDSEAAALNILFLGNSYTNYDNLPNRIKLLAADAGWASPNVTKITPGGQTLIGHSTNSTVQNAISNGPSAGVDWDVVVLQDQSQTPANPSTTVNNFYPGALSLYDQVQASNPEAQVVLFETWARRADYDFTTGFFIGTSADDMQDRLSAAYNFAADTYIPTNSTAVDKTDVRVAEVGEAWRASYADDANFALHTGDKSHPSADGTYLAALMLYSEIYLTGVDGLFNGGNANVTTADATRLQGIASGLIPDAYTRIAGDANDDGLVDQLDLDFVDANLGTSTARAFNGDLNGDGFVDNIDRQEVVTNIPEPTSLILLGAGAIVLVGRRPRR